jgi:metal-responsive CopG/Arc/MetJ family transcriptional regulator
MTVQTTKATKVMISLPPALLSELDAEASKAGSSRSGFLRQLLEQHLAEQRRRDLRALLAEGYQRNAERDLAISEEFAHADYEVASRVYWSDAEE